MSETEHVGGDKPVIGKVHFSYDVNPVFDGFNLDVAPGEFLSVTGPSGYEKSNIAKSVIRFFATRQWQWWW